MFGDSLDTWRHPFMRSAVLALSASNLLQLYLFQRDSFSTPGNVRRVDNPTVRVCMKHAVAFYSDALGVLAKARSGGSQSPFLILATVLLLALFEWESGSVEASFVHISGAEALVCSLDGHIPETSSMPFLLRGWAEMRAQMNRRKLPFRALESELSSVEHVQAMVLSRQVFDSPTLLSSLVTDAYALRNRLVLQTCVGSDGTDGAASLRLCRAWYSQAFGFFYGIDTEDGQNVLTRSEILSRLSITHGHLQSWYEARPASEVPVPPQASEAIDQSTRVVPLAFQSHSAAVQYLQYAIGWVLSSRQLLDLYLFNTKAPPVDEPLHPAAIHLLSVIEGLDPTDNLVYDAYGSGPLWVFDALALCVPDLRVTSHLLDKVLPRFEGSSHAKALLLNLTQTRRRLTCIHSQIQAGRRSLLCDANSVITEDLIPSGTARLGDKMAIFGRDDKGSYFNDLVEPS